MSNLLKLQEWYNSQCNDDWEHIFGVKIETLDNPGWRLVIDLEDTNLETRNFQTVEYNYKLELDWFICEVKNKKFYGSSGPLLLEETIEVFLNWKDNI